MFRLNPHKERSRHNLGIQDLQTGMSGESVNAVTEQIKTVFAVDLTPQGNQTAQSWGTDFQTDL